MKKTYKEIKSLDRDIKDLNQILETEQNWAKSWNLSFYENQSQLKKIENLKSKIFQKKKERIVKLETLMQNVQFEIGISNSKLRPHEFVEVGGGLILENDAGL